MYKNRNAEKLWEGQIKSIVVSSRHKPLSKTVLFADDVQYCGDKTTFFLHGVEVGTFNDRFYQVDVLCIR